MLRRQKRAVTLRGLSVTAGDLGMFSGGYSQGWSGPQSNQVFP
jgi:hypothetical protein